MVLFVACAAMTACTAANELLAIEEPKQKGTANSVGKRGEADYEQRRKDCWDMPSAEACYEVGLDYELGLSTTRDPKKAAEYYTKACELEKQEEHCEAAARVHDP